MAIFDKVKELIADLKGVNLFTFLRENKIYARLRERAMVLLNKKKEETADKVEEYLRDKSPIAKAKLVNWIMANIELGFPFNLFKGKIVIKSTKTLEIDINQVAFVLAISIASLFKSLIPL